MEDYDKAIQCFQEVVKLESGNHSALQQIQVCHQKIHQKMHQNLEREKTLYAKMFKTSPKRLTTDWYKWRDE